MPLSIILPVLFLLVLAALLFWLSLKALHRGRIPEKPRKELELVEAEMEGIEKGIHWRPNK